MTWSRAALSDDRQVRARIDRVDAALQCRFDLDAWARDPRNLGSPLVLVDPHRLDPRRIVILGGTAAVSQAVQDRIADLLR